MANRLTRHLNAASWVGQSPPAMLVKLSLRIADTSRSARSCQNGLESEVMTKTWRGPTNDVAICPYCRKDVPFLSSWSFRGLWGYKEVRTYECSEHGPIFVSPQIAVEHGPDKGR